MAALKMDLTEGSEASANINQTQGKHPKVDIINTEHGESLKSRGVHKLYRWLREPTEWRITILGHPIFSLM
jgi:hypothetical protein